MNDFPVSGVIGVVANDAGELDQAVAHQLSCVSENRFIELVKETKRRELGCLVTVRHPSHGGSFEGTEEARLSLNLAALDAGADLVDLEWDSQAAQLAASEAGLPFIASYHNFEAMLTDAQLDELSERMNQLHPVALKVVPTASTTLDAFRMLQWVANRPTDSLHRIGFAMGGKGAPSRILTTACGGAVSYAAFGEVVAPGQVSLDDMLLNFRCQNLDRDTLVTAIVPAPEHTGEDDEARNRRVSEKQNSLNADWRSQGENRVAIGFADDTPETMASCSGQPLAIECLEV